MLDKIITGRKIIAPRAVIYGAGKVGKSTFAASAPSPIFIQTEDGADELGVARFPLATSLAEVTAALDSLINDKQSYQTVVIDSLDWLERLVQADVCKNNGWQSIEAPGYGKGYAEVVKPWIGVLAQLDILRSKGMAAITICHSEIKRFDSPEVEPYDRYQLKLHKAITAVTSEWADVIGFACKEVRVAKAEVGFNKEVRRGVSNGKHVLRLQDAPAYCAGNRYGLPASIDLSWDAFMSAFAARTQSTAT